MNRRKGPKEEETEIKNSKLELEYQRTIYTCINPGI